MISASSRLTLRKHSRAGSRRSKPDWHNRLAACAPLMSLRLRTAATTTMGELRRANGDRAGSAFAWLFLALRLSLRGRAIPASHLWMLPSHLSVTRSHLGTMRSRLRLARPWSHLTGPVSGATSSSGSFAGVRFGLVSPSASHVTLISGLELVPVCSTVSCPSGSLVSGFDLVPVCSGIS